MTTRLTSRIAALGAALAVGSAGLIAVSPTADAAIAGKAGYTCQTSFGAQAATVTTKLPLPKSAKRGTKVPAKKVVLTVQLSEDLAAALRGFGITSLSGSAEKATAKVGSLKLPLVGIAFKDQAVPASGPMKITAVGKTAPLKLKKKGTQAVSIPKSFLFSAQDQNGNPLIADSTCALDAGQKSKIGSIKVK